MESHEIKHPDSDIDFGRNWGDNPDTEEKGWLNPGEVIVNSVWVISSLEEAVPTLEMSDQGSNISIDGKVTAIFLKSGTDGVQYLLANSIITTDNNGLIRKETKISLLTCKKGC